jgi:hypothetical protein
MITAEIEKNLIVSEIEENLQNNNSQKRKFFQEADTLVIGDSDNILNEDSINVAFVKGLDSRINLHLPLLKTSTVKATQRIDDVDDPYLEYQFEYLIAGLESLDLVDLIYTGEDSEIDIVSAKDRVLNLKLPKNTFEPLHSAIKTINPSLLKALLQLQMLPGLQKSNKRFNRKEKKKDRRTSRDAKDLEKFYSSNKYRLPRKEKKDKDLKSDISSDDIHSKKYKELLGLLIAKMLQKILIHLI